MGLIYDLRRMLRRETAAAKDWVEEAVGDANAELGRAERRLSEDPCERLQATLEDIEAGREGYEAIRDRAEGRVTRPAAETELAEADLAEAAPAGGSGASATDGPARMPDPAAAPATPSAPEAPLPGMAMARLWVTLEPGGSAMGAGWHQLTIDEAVGPVVGEDWFAEQLAATVAALPEVAEAVHEDREVLHVRGDGLTGEEARRLVASVLAPHIGEDWQDRLA